MENENPGQNFGYLKIVFFLILLLCLEVVISSFEPFPSVFEGGVFVFYIWGGGGYVENEDLGQFH